MNEDRLDAMEKEVADLRKNIEALWHQDVERLINIRELRRHVGLMPAHAENQIEADRVERADKSFTEIMEK